MKKLLGLFLSFSLMVPIFPTNVFAEENTTGGKYGYSSEELKENLRTDAVENEDAKKEIKEEIEETSKVSMSQNTSGETVEPIQESVVSVTVDGVTTDYTSFKEALERKIEGKEIVVKLQQNIDFTNDGIYANKTQTNGIYLEIGTEYANVVLDLNGHDVTNHFKNPNGNFPARGFSLTMNGGSFKVINSSTTGSNFDVERLGQVKSKNSKKIIEFAFGDNITTNTKDLDLQHVVSKYSDFYLGFNGGFKGLQEDGSYNFYTSASDAVKNSTNHTAILVNNYTGSANFSASTGTTGIIDLNDKSFTTLSTAFNLLNSDVNITIKNGTVHAMNDNCNKDTPNVGFIGDSAHDVENITLTLENVNVVSNYYRGIDFHGTDTDLHLNLINSTLTMQNADSYGIYMPAKNSSVNIQNSSIQAGTGIAVKGGTLNVVDSKIQSNGIENVPNEGTSSGFIETGDAIYVDGFYQRPIDVNIKNSEVMSENAKAVRDLFVDETVNSTKVEIESGKFSSDVLKYVSPKKASIKADSYYYVGTNQEIYETAKEAKESIEILTGIDSIEVLNGVKVTNKTGNDVTVNGDVVKNNQTIIADTVPTAQVTYSNEGDWTNKDVTVTIKTSEPVNDIDGWEKVDNQTFMKVYPENAVETVTIMDMTGNSIKVKVDVQNIDKQAPRINGVEDIVLEQGEVFDSMAGVSAYDVECGPINDIKVTVIGQTSIDTNIVGVYTLQYSVSDMAGNTTTVKRIVTVNPKIETLNSLPTINAKDIVLMIGDTFDPLKDVTATDREDGNITKNLEVIKNAVDTTKVGAYEVTYKVTDSQGALTTKTIKVMVKSKEVSVPNTDSSNTPSTGDKTNIGLYVVLITISGVGIALLSIWKKKKNLGSK